MLITGIPLAAASIMVTGAFTMRRIEGMRPLVQRIVDSLIDERTMVSDLTHRLLDLAWEDYRVNVLAEEPRGSTGRGITPAYLDEVGQAQITFADFLPIPGIVTISAIVFGSLPPYFSLIAFAAAKIFFVFAR